MTGSKSGALDAMDINAEAFALMTGSVVSL